MRIVEVHDAGSVVAVVTGGGMVPFEHRAYRELEASRGGIDMTTSSALKSR